MSDSNMISPTPDTPHGTPLRWADFDLRKCADGLLPVVVQDSVTLRVLMLGYMNEAAYERTLAMGRVTFYSRTRQTLWTKGETSGHFLDVVNLFPDCDRDTLLIQATPHGPTCHRGTTACFDTAEDEGFIRSLADLTRERHADMPEGSYTTRLFIKGVKAIAKKVGEEATEAIIEAVDHNRSRFVYEAGDLMYHYLVLLEAMGVSLSDLEHELRLRHGK